MLNDERLKGRWSKELNELPEVKEFEMQYLYLTHRDIPGASCGHQYLSEFVGNRHPSRDIIADVKTTAWYFGQVINESTKRFLVKPGKNNEVYLGCTGFANDSGGYDTEYEREITGGAWG